MDMFEKEQVVYNNAIKHANALGDNVPSGSRLYVDLSNEYETLTKEYGKLLRRFRKVTKFFDVTVGDFGDLAEKVHYDSLTGAYNRYFLEASLRKNIKKLSRSDSILSVIFLDVDYFKQYNDTYGHAAGDNCLVSITDTLLRCITRENDIVARYGGEEFVIVLPHTDEQGAQMVAVKVIRHIMERNIPHEKSEIADRVTVSIGGTTVKVNHKHKATDYIKRADEAMYISKEGGRNRYTYLEFVNK